MSLRAISIFILTAILGLLTGYFLSPRITMLFDSRMAADEQDEVKEGDREEEALATGTGTRPRLDLDDLFDIGDDIFTDEDADDGGDMLTDVADATSFEDDGDYLDDETLDDETAAQKARERREEIARSIKHDPRPGVNEENYTGSLNAALWRNPKQLKARLAGSIRGRLSSTKPEHIEKVIKEPQVRLMLAQWELIDQSDMEGLRALMRDPKVCRELSPLLNDLRWMSAFVYDGELGNPEVALAMIYHFRQVDPKMDDCQAAEASGGDKFLKRRIAAAVAAEFARQGWYGNDDKPLSAKEIREMRANGIPLPAQTNRSSAKKDTFRLARERYQFFAESADQDLLNANFATMPNWLMRYACGWKGTSAFGTASTMRWLRDNCSAPAQAYTGMGGAQVPYLPTNIYGDSIHGPYYYQPFDVLYPGNFAKETRDVGAVCGGVSHFGASSACANGVPAITVGEPGHCAYAVYLDDKWIPCYSIFEERYPHWNIWGDSSWSSLNAQALMYQQGARTRNAQFLSTLGAMLAQVGNPVNSIKVYEMALIMQPLNRPTWTNYLKTATNAFQRQPRRWMEVNEFVCSAVTPTGPKMSADFLEKEIYPAMFKLVRDNKKKFEVFETFFKHLKTNEPTEWDMTPLLSMQFNSLTKAHKPRQDYYSILVNGICKAPEFGVAITWAVRQAFSDHKMQGEQVLKKIDAARDTSPNKALVDAAVIRAAEEMKDMELFQRLSKPYVDAAEKSLPEFPRPSGNLISDKGIIYLGKAATDQKIYTQHAAALTEKGGLIKSEGSKHQTVILELPRSTPIGGIVIIPANGCGSYYEWALETSTDGKNWTPLLDLPDRENKPYLCLNIERNNPRAKFIRIDSGADQHVGINFKAILVYDTRKAK